MWKRLALLTLGLSIPAFAQLDPGILQRTADGVPNPNTQMLQQIQQMQAIKAAQQQQQMLKIQTEQEQLRLRQMQQAQFDDLKREKLDAPLAVAPTTTVRLQDAMSFTDFQNAGLHKLTPEELLKLNAWLSAKLTEVVQTLTQSAVNTPHTRPNPSN